MVAIFNSKIGKNYELRDNSASVLNILENSNADAFSDEYVTEQLKRLSDKIKNVLEELE
jgi:hypothetical protein